MTKRKIIILFFIFLILIFGLIFGIFYVRKIKIQKKEKEETSREQWHKLPSINYKLLASQAEEAKIFSKPEKIINEIIDSPVIRKQDIYFCNEKGISKYSLKERKKELIFSIYPCNNILWSPRGEEGYVISGTTTTYFNLKTKEVKELSKNIVNIIWDNKKNRIVYQFLNLFSGENELYLADPKIQNPEKIIKLDKKEEVNFLAWQEDNLYWTYGESTDLSGRPLWQGNIKTKQKIELTEWGSNVSYIMNLGDRLIFETLKTDKQGRVRPILYLVSPGEKRKLKLETFLNKCVKKDNSTIICGISEDLYSLRSNELIAEVDLESNSIVPLTKKNEKQKINLRDLFLSEDKTKLFFINNIDGKLWGLSLK